MSDFPKTGVAEINGRKASANGKARTDKGKRKLRSERLKRDEGRSSEEDEEAARKKAERSFSTKRRKKRDGVEGASVES